MPEEDHNMNQGENTTTATIDGKVSDDDGVRGVDVGAGVIAGDQCDGTIYSENKGELKQAEDERSSSEQVEDDKKCDDDKVADVEKSESDKATEEEKPGRDTVAGEEKPGRDNVAYEKRSGSEQLADGNLNSVQKDRERQDNTHGEHHYVNMQTLIAEFKEFQKSRKLESGLIEKGLESTSVRKNEIEVDLDDVSNNRLTTLEPDLKNNGSYLKNDDSDLKIDGSVEKNTKSGDGNVDRHFVNVRSLIEEFKSRETAESALVSGTVYSKRRSKEIDLNIEPIKTEVSVEIPLEDDLYNKPTEAERRVCVENPSGGDLVDRHLVNVRMWEKQLEVNKSVMQRFQDCLFEVKQELDQRLQQLQTQVEQERKSLNSMKADAGRDKFILTSLKDRIDRADTKNNEARDQLREKIAVLDETIEDMLAVQEENPVDCSTEPRRSTRDTKTQHKHNRKYDELNKKFEQVEKRLEKKLKEFRDHGDSERKNMIKVLAPLQRTVSKMASKVEVGRLRHRINSFNSTDFIKEHLKDYFFNTRIISRDHHLIQSHRNIEMDALLQRIRAMEDRVESFELLQLTGNCTRMRKMERMKDRRERRRKTLSFVNHFVRYSDEGDTVDKGWIDEVKDKDEVKDEDKSEDEDNYQDHVYHVIENDKEEEMSKEIVCSANKGEPVVRNFESSLRNTH